MVFVRFLSLLRCHRERERKREENKGQRVNLMYMIVIQHPAVHKRNKNHTWTRTFSGQTCERTYIYLWNLSKHRLMEESQN